MAGPSINTRLMIAGSLWTALALVVAGFFLTGLFRQHVESEFDATLTDQMEEILELVEVGPEGSTGLKRHPVDPRFNRRHSGWYWQTMGGAESEFSRSLAGERLSPPETLHLESHTAFKSRDRRGMELRGIARQFAFPGSAHTLAVVVTGPAAAFEASVREFMGALALVLIVLGLGLVFGLVAQVRFGLRPLSRLRATLADIRAGRASRLEGNYPTDLEPLADELNALIDHNRDLIEGARQEAGDLAHALKTPLSVLTNLGDHLHDETGEVLRRQTEALAASVEWHVSRTRTKGRRRSGSSQAALGPVIEGLCRMLERSYQERGIVIVQGSSAGLVFAGETQDLEEMLGNLLDNACKWARQRVEVKAERNGGRLRLAVEDDGPGIPESQLSEVLERGHRLDPSVAGSGLGLSIVHQVATLYGGDLTLKSSPSGGLRATLELPAQ